ncbi:MAG: hypothetical protein DSM106950_23405, partial [Stigonema ocellatum SAG 48.90 = DSM 106950]|nr:hypothetical protein [Stigonema ocellatum SAG 48.90 = DSM 106950]
LPYPRRTGSERRWHTTNGMNGFRDLPLLRHLPVTNPSRTNPSPIPPSPCSSFPDEQGVPWYGDNKKISVKIFLSSGRSRCYVWRIGN